MISSTSMLPAASCAHATAVARSTAPAAAFDGTRAPFAALAAGVAVLGTAVQVVDPPPRGAPV